MEQQDRDPSGLTVKQGLEAEGKTGGWGSGEMALAEMEVRNNPSFYQSRTEALRRSWTNLRDFKKENLQEFMIKWTWRDEGKEAAQN